MSSLKLTTDFARIDYAGIVKIYSHFNAIHSVFILLP